jgi:hypothetical protein
MNNKQEPLKNFIRKYIQKPFSKYNLKYNTKTINSEKVLEGALKNVKHRGFADHPPLELEDFIFRDWLGHTDISPELEYAIKQRDKYKK